ncbi:aminotransferase class I/II-fold pyridoxal phosphate-dependent enzyme, partial [Enterococcus faecalis]|uniref:aminotransferase class I/II-fold pyridoxal phosphate-dependent enzyme n=1 Tax=Enterococcus faecalis TaxID=1351 RepID=UPI0040398B22
AGHRIELPAERLLLTNGAQHAIMIALGLICRPGDALLVESVTYAGAKAAARLLGLRLVGLEMDGEGIRSAALAAALGGRDR